MNIDLDITEHAISSSKKRKKDVIDDSELVILDEIKCSNVATFEKEVKPNLTTLSNLEITNEVKKEQSEKLKCDNVVTFTSEEIKNLAINFGLDPEVSAEERIDRAARNMNNVVKYMLAAGIDLMSLREECDHGLFLKLLAERGIERRSAYRAIQYAQFMLALPEQERKKLLAYPKSHVLALASADPEVVEDLLQDDEIDLKSLSVRELRETIKDLDRKKTDLSVQLETKELEVQELKSAVEALRENRVSTSGTVPLQVQEARLEIAALFKKAEMSVQDMDKLVHEFMEMDGLSDWHLPVKRNLFTAVMALHAYTGSVLTGLKSSGYEIDGEAGTLDIFSHEEALRCANEYKALTDEHRHEKILREWEREQNRPRGKGRPRSKPEE